MSDLQGEGMSRWTEQFKSHQIHNDYVHLQSILADISANDLPKAEEMARLKKVVDFVASSIDAMDPEIGGYQALNSMHSYVQSVISEIGSYSSDGALGHLQNANSQFDAIVSILVQAPLVVYGNSKAQLTRAVTAYSESMHDSAESFEKSLSDVKDGIVEGYRALDELHESAVATQDKLDGRISSMEAELPKLLAVFNANFQQSEKDRSDKFETWTADFQEKLDRQFVSAEKKFVAGEVVMGEHLDNAAKVLGAVLDTGQAGAYAMYANEERKSANGYRISAIVLMGLAAMVLFMPELFRAVKSVAEHSIDWQAALSRLPFSLVLFAPALYMARESSRHRSNEVVNRRRQHILTTIGPYLALLDPKKAEDIKVDVAKSIFRDEVGAVEESGADAAGFFSKLIDVVSKK
ncbi:hypothetical protein ACQQ2N_01305 [Dokdonella sp. MW10]|uniref:hypothetical protein n=1 Tax=Dokdonella sp. MW10 TaxID=2992926 RepID=UPI003F7ECE20